MDTWQYDLAAAKQFDKNGDNNGQPTWIGNLTLTECYTATLSAILSRLAAMVQVESEPARRAYFDQLVKELIRIAYVQTRVAQLSQQPTEPYTKPIGEMIKQLAVWLRV